MSRAAEAWVNLSALNSNLERVRQAAPDSRVVAVIKANGYGHGMVRVANALTDADAFAVASIDEALELRQAGITQPILLLEGFFTVDELTLIQQHQLSIVLHHNEQLQTIEALATMQELDERKPLSVWLKLDTGMHRLGFAPERLVELVERLHHCRLVDRPITVMTHLANADDRQDPMTESQLTVFKQHINELPEDTDVSISIANSAGILAWPSALGFKKHDQWVRPGIMLYGVSPFIDGSAQEDGLKPVMTLRSRLIAIKMLRAGDTVGYGGSWQCPEDMAIGVVAIGYGDGYPRSAPSGTPVLINGQRLPLVGRVSMDMITIDLRQQEHVAVGDEVILWGEGLPVEEIAARAGTIAYELLCGITRRVRFIDYNETAQ